MKQLSKFLMAGAVATMAVAPAVAAPANPAASLSVAKAVRASAPATKGNRLGGGESTGLLIAVGAGLAIIAAVIIVGSEGSKDATSP